MSAIILGLILLLTGAFLVVVFFDVAVFLLAIFGFVAVMIVTACIYKAFKDGIRGFVNSVKEIFGCNDSE